MTDLAEIARGAVERHLGDMDDISPDAIYDHAYTLGLDALIDRGVDPQTARPIAMRVAEAFAAP
jgi:hypothetical protein